MHYDRQDFVCDCRYMACWSLHILGIVFLDCGTQTEGDRFARVSSSIPPAPRIRKSLVATSCRRARTSAHRRLYGLFHVPPSFQLIVLFPSAISPSTPAPQPPLTTANLFASVIYPTARSPFSLTNNRTRPCAKMAQG